MKELGALLKEAREGLQIPLREISEKTKIQLHYLEALENGDFSKFTRDVYLKGALKSYAVAVGLDPAEVLARYLTLKGEPAAPEKPAAASREKPPPPPRPYRGDRGPSFIYGIIVLILLLAAGGYWFADQYRQRTPPAPDPGGNQSGTQSPGNQTPGEDEPEPGETSPLKPEVKIKISATESTSLETVFTVANAEKLELKLLCDERCWIKMLVDGKEEIPQKNLSPGEKITANATGKIWLRLGHPRGVKVTMNGIEVKTVKDEKNAHNFLFVLK